MERNWTLNRKIGKKKKKNRLTLKKKIHLDFDGLRTSGSPNALLQCDSFSLPKPAKIIPFEPGKTKMKKVKKRKGRNFVETYVPSSLRTRQTEIENFFKTRCSDIEIIGRVSKKVTKSRTIPKMNLQVGNRLKELIECEIRFIKKMHEFSKRINEIHGELLTENYADILKTILFIRDSVEKLVVVSIGLVDGIVSCFNIFEDDQQDSIYSPSVQTHIFEKFSIFFNEKHPIESYCEYIDARHLLTQFMKSKIGKKVIAGVFGKKGTMMFGEFMIEPIQRFPKVKLLMKDILRYENGKVVESGIRGQLELWLRTLNEKQKEVGQKKSKVNGKREKKEKKKKVKVKVKKRKVKELKIKKVKVKKRKVKVRIKEKEKEKRKERKGNDEKNNIVQNNTKLKKLKEDKDNQEVKKAEKNISAEKNDPKFELPIIHKNSESQDHTIHTNATKQKQPAGIETPQPPPRNPEKRGPFMEMRNISIFKIRKRDKKKSSKRGSKRVKLFSSSLSFHPNYIQVSRDISARSDHTSISKKKKKNIELCRIEHLEKDEKVVFVVHGKLVFVQIVNFATRSCRKVNDYAFWATEKFKINLMKLETFSRGKKYKVVDVEKMILEKILL